MDNQEKILKEILKTLKDNELIINTHLTLIKVLEEKNKELKERNYISKENDLLFVDLYVYLRKWEKDNNIKTNQENIYVDNFVDKFLILVNAYIKENNNKNGLVNDK
jgi:hypothetical protein